MAKKKNNKQVCYYCKEDISKGNAKFILRELTIIGYSDYEFCSARCLINYIFKKFKGLVKRMGR